MEIKLIIYDKGDTSVGIQPASWEIECPFIDPEEKDTIEYFRKEMISIFEGFCNGKCQAEYNFENKYKDNDFE